jgi:hypothetical protein
VMNRSLNQFSLQVMAWAAVVVLGGLAAMAQTSTPSSPTPPDAPGRTSHSALPDTPSPAPSQVQSPQAPRADAEHPVAVTGAQMAQITILEDTLIRVMTNEPINSKRAERGMPMLFTVSEDVLVGDALAIPRGATVHGEVIKSKRSGVLTGSPELTFKLVSLDLGGRNYPLYTYQFKVTGTSKTGPTETKALRGAAVGAVAGALLGGVSAKGGVQEADGTGRAVSMATGAAVGAGVGTAVSAATPGPGIWIPSEAQIDFYLSSPIAVTPVSAKEAARLEEGLRPGGPSLYVRGDTP